MHLPFAYRVRHQTFFRFLLVGSALTAAAILLPFTLYHYLSDEPQLEGALISLTDFGPELLSPRHSWQHDQTYGGRACWTIVSQLPGSSRIHHLIDPETGFERARYLDTTVEGKRHQISMHFTDYRPSGGHTLPHAYSRKVNGTLCGQARIDSIQSNQGLIPWMFSMDVP